MSPEQEIHKLELERELLSKQVAGAEEQLIELRSFARFAEAVPTYPLVYPAIIPSWFLVAALAFLIWRGK